MTETGYENPEMIPFLDFLISDTPRMASGVLFTPQLRLSGGIWGSLTYPINVSVNLHCMLLKNQIAIYTKFLI